MSPALHPIYRFGEFEVDTLARTLKRGDSVVFLGRRSFDLLLHFVLNSGKVLGKDELLKKIWPDTFVDENSLAKSISVLRKAVYDLEPARKYQVRDYGVSIMCARAERAYPYPL